MFRKILYRLLLVRHPWRYIGFDELSELYTSTMLRSMGLSLIGIFVPIYLYKLGYELSTVFLFMAGLFLARMVFDVIASYIVARVGPKHTMLFSFILQIIALLLLLTLPQLNWPLWIISITWGVSLSMFFIAYHVDFSKIIHQNHGGKELGFMTIVERIGMALGPLVGGVVATVFGAEYTIAAAVVVFVAAVVPLLFSAEPTVLHQKISYRGLPYSKLIRDFFSFGMNGMSNTITVAVWPLFVAITIFTVNTYANVGIVTSIGIVAAILTARFIGRVVDRRRGGSLLRWSAISSSFLHLVRPFVQSYGGVVLMNAASEAAVTGHKLPYTKAMYARADELPGFRIVYITCMEVAADIGKASAWLLIFGLSLAMDGATAMQLSFLAASLAALLITTQRFPSLKPSLL